MKLAKLLIALTLMPFLSLSVAAETLGVPDSWTFTPEQTQLMEREILGAHRRAQITGQSPEGMGFLNPNSAHLPPLVQRSARSTFKIVSAGGDRVPYQQIFPNLTLEAAIQAINAKPNQEGFGPVEKEIYRFQLQECLRINVRNCQIYSGLMDGSAFVTGDGKDLRTAAHVVKAIVRDALAGTQFGRPAMVLVDGNGRIVARPDELNARLSATPRGVLSNESQNGKNFNLDQVILRVEKQIAQPITLASRSLNPGEPIFIAGYPIKLDDRDHWRAQNSDGRSLIVARGTVLSPQALRDRLAIAGLRGTDEQFRQLTRDGVASTADGGPSQSGGPMLNIQGEVVGIYTNGVPHSGAVYPFRVSYGGNWLLQSPQR